MVLQLKTSQFVPRSRWKFIDSSFDLKRINDHEERIWISIGAKGVDIIQSWHREINYASHCLPNLRSHLTIRILYIVYLYSLPADLSGRFNIDWVWGVCLRFLYKGYQTWRWSSIDEADEVWLKKVTWLLFGWFVRWGHKLLFSSRCASHCSSQIFRYNTTIIKNFDYQKHNDPHWPCSAERPAGLSYTVDS